MSAEEVNFDGLVGPTHNYAGLAYGNVASADNALRVSSPKTAARQGLAKMKTLRDMGLAQAVLPPHERPDVDTLRLLGFGGSEAEVLARVAREAPRLLQVCASASSMWTANAATVSPSPDTADGRVHFSPANLASKLHRCIEPATTARVLQAIFDDERHFVHHGPLPCGEHFADEGAANHGRLCERHGDDGVELFVFGRSAFDDSRPAPSRFPARQTLEASTAIARLHCIDPSRVVFAQQDPRVIDAGAFHNDVIAVTNCHVLLCHERAFLERNRVLRELAEKLDTELCLVEVPDSSLSVDDAVATYLFNSQLVSLPDGSMSLIAPGECRDHPSVAACLHDIVNGDNPIAGVRYLDVRESMRNGGGPACLRLRVVLTQAQRRAANPLVFLDEALYQKLDGWIDRHYRDRLAAEDLADPSLLDESRQALDELTRLLDLGSVYRFQDSRI